uniref:Uncharacterized protein n=1 Tax=Physcomitrium patens TaxID=3218 RepID=A0A2K1L350_PHYPA|nr:hypothetical protein PHYPA_003247 [Physcomitrium patens]
MTVSSPQLHLEYLRARSATQQCQATSSPAFVSDLVAHTELTRASIILCTHNGSNVHHLPPINTLCLLVLQPYFTLSKIASFGHIQKQDFITVNPNKTTRMSTQRITWSMSRPMWGIWGSKPWSSTREMSSSTATVLVTFPFNDDPVVKSTGNNPKDSAPVPTTDSDGVRANASPPPLKSSRTVNSTSLLKFIVKKALKEVTNLEFRFQSCTGVLCWQRAEITVSS